MDFRFGGENDTFASEVRAFLEREMTRDRVHADAEDLSGLAEPFERALHIRPRASTTTSAPRWRRASGRGSTSSSPRSTPRSSTPRSRSPDTHSARSASDAQRARFVPLVERGEIEMCIAYTEEHAGSDLGAQVASAISDARRLRPLGSQGARDRRAQGRLVHHHRAHVPRRPGARRPQHVPRRHDAPGHHGGAPSHHERLDARRDHVRRRAARARRPARSSRTQAGASSLTTVAAERSGMFYLGFARHVLDELIEYVGHGDARRPPARRRSPRARSHRPTRPRGGGGRCGSRSAPCGASSRAVPILRSRRWPRSTRPSCSSGSRRRPPRSRGPPAWCTRRCSPSSRRLTRPAGGRFACEYLERVHGTIGGGTNEVQRDAIAQFGLALPRTRR